MPLMGGGIAMKKCFLFFAVITLVVGLTGCPQDLSVTADFRSSTGEETTWGVLDNFEELQIPGSGNAVLRLSGAKIVTTSVQPGAVGKYLLFNGDEIVLPLDGTNQTFVKNGVISAEKSGEEHIAHLLAIGLLLSATQLPGISGQGQQVNVPIGPAVFEVTVTLITTKGPFVVIFTRDNGNGDGDIEPGLPGDVWISSTAGEFEGPGVYIDPLGHNDLRRLFLGLRENAIDQLGLFAWFPEVASANGTPLTRAYNMDNRAPVVIPLAPIYDLAPAGATFVAIAVFGYNRFQPNQDIPDWAGDAFTSGYPYWWNISEWNILLDGSPAQEATGQFGQKLGYILIPLPVQPIQTFSLSASFSGSGTVSGAGTYNTGTSVTVTAVPATGWRLDRWEGDLSGSTNPATVIMDRNRSVTAVFVQSASTQFTVSVSISGSGSVSGAGGYPAGSAVTLVATPATGWRFDRWEGSMSGSNSTLIFTANTNVALTAVFVQSTTPPTTDAVVQFNRSGTSATMQICLGADATLRGITADGSVGNLPTGATFADIVQIGVEVVDISSPWYFIREVGNGSMMANGCSSIIQLDGVGTDYNGNAKTVPVSNWTGGMAVPFYVLRNSSARFYLNKGILPATIDGQSMVNGAKGYIWP